MTQDTIMGACLRLEGALTMRTVETVRATLREAIAPLAAVQEGNVSVASLAIDCSAATEIDLTFVQLLVAIRVSAQRLGGTVSLASAPDGALLDTLTRGGFRAVRETNGTGGSVDANAAAFWFAGADA
jgi:ABC-type transporter Mla MlaB component